MREEKEKGQILKKKKIIKEKKKIMKNEGYREGYEYEKEKKDEF